MDVCVCETERERERERDREREREMHRYSIYACVLVVFYNRWLDLSLGLRMRSTTVKEAGSCMLPHLILKPYECQCSSMSSSLEHKPLITFCGLDGRNGLSLTVSFHEKIENERRNKGRSKRNSDWLLKRAILPFNQSDFWLGFLWTDLNSLPNKIFSLLFFTFSFPFHDRELHNFSSDLFLV